MQNRLCPYVYIDKTQSLEEGIRRFPSIYVEGNAAVGKTTAVKMLLEKHPEVESVVFDVSQEVAHCEKFTENLRYAQEKLRQDNCWVIFENIPKELNSLDVKNMVQMVLTLTNESKVIFISREKPQTEFLELLWKRKMHLIGADELLFSQGDIAKLASYYESELRVEKVYEKTKGWAGCTDLLFRLSGRDNDVEKLLERYEVKSYIQKEILGSLEDSDRYLVETAWEYPWVNAEICEQVLGIVDAGERLSDLQRKGFFAYDSDRQRWKLIPLFQQYHREESSLMEKMAKWYSANEYLTEAVFCLRKLNDEQKYQELLCSHYDQAGALGLIEENVLNWNGKQPELCYLRGACCYNRRDFEGLKKEIGLLQKIKEKDHKTKEILLNLGYMNVEIPLVEWMNQVGEFAGTGEKFRLYQILGNSVTCLCGIRDLSALFACGKREEKQYGNLWREVFGIQEWECYCLAKMDYYLETDRKDSVNMEEWALLAKNIDGETVWQLRVAKLYLLCKLQRIQPEEERRDLIFRLRESLAKEPSSVCRVVAESIINLYAPWYGERERMSKWLRVSVMDSNVTVNEENYLMFYCRAKGYILLNQYDRADKILKKLVPYLQEYHRYRLLAEALFQCALIGWSKELRGQAIKNTIESLVVTGNSRYVIFYAAYGQNGLQVLEAYTEWMRSNAPEGWKQKKKYNYGNVLRMPAEDYVQVLLRCAKKALKKEGAFDTIKIQEHLTMMETIVLQDIGMGKSNAQICAELELKLPTVKGHIYSLFKKLGVNSRVQAVIKGKELGILE